MPVFVLGCSSPLKVYLIDRFPINLQLQQAFQEKEDENVRLKHYIDTILLNIVENYPQLLEVKPMERK